MSISPQWTIVGEAGKRLNATSRTFAELKAYGVVIDHSDLSASTCQFSITLPGLVPSGSDLFPEEGQKVSVFRSGARFFQGTCTTCEQDDFTVNVTISDIIWDMELEPFTSDQVDTAASTAERPSYAFPSQSLTTSLNSVITRAAAKGIDIAVGSLAATFTAPEISLKQMTCAQAVAEMIRLTPDVMGWVDHSPTTPTYNTARRKTATVRTIAAGPNVKVRLKKETRLKIEYVDIAGVTRAADGGAIWTSQVSGDAGTAQAGGSTTITLRSGASTNNGSYVGAEITILTGTGAGQKRTISSYNGSTKVATVSASWTTNPNNTSTYRIGGGLGTTRTRMIHAVSGEELDTYLPKNYFDNFPLQTATTSGTPFLSYLIAKVPEFAALKTKYSYSTATWPMVLLTSPTSTLLVTPSNQTVTVLNGMGAPTFTKPDGTAATLTGKTLVLSEKPPEWMTQFDVEEVKVKASLYFLFQVAELDITGNTVLRTKPAWITDINWTLEQVSAGTVRIGTVGTTSKFSSVTFYRKDVEVSGYLINTSAPSVTTVYRPQDYTYVSPPAGFASGMQESNGFDVYSGTISFRSALPGATRYRGCVVNVTGHRPEYETMLACVRGETLDLDSGITTLTLGAPQRFSSYANFMDRIRSRGSNNVKYL